VDAKLQARIAEAEKTIAATRSAAMANVQGIASDTAPAIVQRLAGITPANDEVTEAVRNVLKR
jgi:F-type H+-transporting ATPase subunit b